MAAGRTHPHHHHSLAAVSLTSTDAVAKNAPRPRKKRNRTIDGVLTNRCRPCASNSLSDFAPAFAALHPLSIHIQRPQCQRSAPPQRPQKWSGRGATGWDTPAWPNGQKLPRLQQLQEGMGQCGKGRWSGRQDSNLRHPAPKAGALPDCATPRRSRALAVKSAARQSRFWPSMACPHRKRADRTKTIRPFENLAEAKIIRRSRRCQRRSQRSRRCRQRSRRCQQR